MTLRVLLLNERCPRHPRAGGAETHLFEVFGRLSPERLQVELLCSGANDRRDTEWFDGVRITRLGSLPRYYARVAAEVRRRTRTGSADLVVEAHNKVPFLTPLYAGVPTLVLHHHYFGWSAFGQANPVIALNTVALEALIPRVYRHARFVTISESSRADLVRRGIAPDRVDVVPCGIDHDVYRAAPVEDREPLLVGVGRLEPSKRWHLLIDAMARLRVDHPHLRAVLVGRGRDLDRLRARRDALGLADRVELAGFLPDAEVAALLQRASLGVQTSRKEGWGLTVIEANACGTPVVAADAPGLRDSVLDGRTGVLVQQPTAAAFAAAIDRCLTNEARRVSMAEEACRRARRFAWDTAAHRIHDVLGRVHAEATTPRAATTPSTAHRPLPTPHPSKGS